MKRLLQLFLVALLSVHLTSCYERIDAGCEGIKVNLYGDDKGVDNVNLCTGAVWYNPLTTSVYEYPMYVQTIDYPAFTVNTKDGSEFIVAPTININPIAGTSPIIFKKYRKELKAVIEEVLYTHIKNAYSVRLNAYTTDELISKREEFEKSTEDFLREVLLKENFELGEMTSGLQYPETIVASVNAKNKAIQDAMRVSNEIQIAQAEAEKIIIKAKAEKEANELKTRALTPQILEQMWIEKWDGRLPTYSTVTTRHH